jgi:hypothetical protein
MGFCEFKSQYLEKKERLNLMLLTILRDEEIWPKKDYGISINLKD